ncbi:hypothetical protein RJ639_002377 [Escallonia herrerae]|uniref:NAC domain-containing protein n=1 Tax=Escallonia herrerae TaxID=1293975 RepID=A0AA89BSI1_9ASTE|nr:hypothetical protein RJ639_002377 [Escallonia herrerae]
MKLPSPEECLTAIYAEHSLAWLHGAIYPLVEEFHFDYLTVGAGEVRLDGFLDGAVAVVEHDGGVAHKFCWTRRRASGDGGIVEDRDLVHMVGVDKVLDEIDLVSPLGDDDGGGAEAEPIIVDAGSGGDVVSCPISSPFRTLIQTAKPETSRGLYTTDGRQELKELMSSVAIITNFSDKNPRPYQIYRNTNVVTNLFLVPITNENQELKGDQLLFNIFRPNSAPKRASFGMATIPSSSSDHEETEEKIPQTYFSAINDRVLPYGFRFSPSDSQLIEHYLVNKSMGRELPSDYITYNAHLYEHHPTAQAPIVCVWRLKSEPLTWSTDISARACRLEDKNIENNENQIVGFKRTSVFYQRMVAEGERTHWTVHEYRVNPKAFPDLDSSLETKIEHYVVCQIRYKDLSRKHREILY